MPLSDVPSVAWSASLGDRSGGWAQATAAANVVHPTLASVKVTVPGEYRAFVVGERTCFGANGPSGFWHSIPADLGDGSLRHYYVGFDPAKTSSVQYGMVHFTVMTNGPVWMLVTARYSNSGNSSEDWIPELTTPAQLAAAGWTKLRSDIYDECGYGPAGTNPIGLQYDLYQRYCTAGESFSIRTEKYAPPVILQSANTSPEISVLLGNSAIADGQSAATDFGTITQGTTGPTRTFTVRNDGNASLVLGAVSLPAGFSLVEGLSTSLAPGQSDTFTVRLDATAAGAKSGQISFATNDGDENPFNFPVTGRVEQAVTVGGTAGADIYYIKLQETDVVVYSTADGTGTPTARYAHSFISNFTITGADGNDRVIVDFSGGNPLPSSGLQFNGGNGADTLKVIGNNGGQAIVVNGIRVLFGSLPIDVTGVDAVELASINASPLTLAGASNVTLAAATHVNGLSIGPDATLDLADHDLIVIATTEIRQQVLTQISGWIETARGSGRWMGRGLTSSEAKAAVANSNRTTGLAVMLNNKSDNQPILSTFAGQSVGANDILVKYTWNGDVNLDGQVDAADYFLVDSGYITQQGSYRNGDLNFDGTVDAADYFLIDSAYIAQTGVLEAASVRQSQPMTSVLKQLFSIEPVL